MSPRQSAESFLHIYPQVAFLMHLSTKIIIIVQKTILYVFNVIINEDNSLFDSAVNRQV